MKKDMILSNKEIEATLEKIQIKDIKINKDVFYRYLKNKNEFDKVIEFLKSFKRDESTKLCSKCKNPVMPTGFVSDNSTLDPDKNGTANYYFCLNCGKSFKEYSGIEKIENGIRYLKVDELDKPKFEIIWYD